MVVGSAVNLGSPVAGWSLEEALDSWFECTDGGTVAVDVDEACGVGLVCSGDTTDVAGGAPGIGPSGVAGEAGGG